MPARGRIAQVSLGVGQTQIAHNGGLFGQLSNQPRGVAFSSRRNPGQFSGPSEWTAGCEGRACGGDVEAAPQSFRVSITGLDIQHGSCSISVSCRRSTAEQGERFHEVAVEYGERSAIVDVSHGVKRSIRKNSVDIEADVP